MTFSWIIPVHALARVLSGIKKYTFPFFSLFWARKHVTKFRSLPYMRATIAYLNHCLFRLLLDHFWRLFVLDSFKVFLDFFFKIIAYNCSVTNFWIISLLPQMKQWRITDVLAQSQYLELVHYYMTTIHNFYLRLLNWCSHFQDCIHFPMCDSIKQLHVIKLWIFLHSFDVLHVFENTAAM